MSRPMNQTMSRKEFLISVFHRFWKCVEKPDNDYDCWIWTGTLNAALKNGMRYGKFCFNDEGKTINIPAHRMAWMLAYGEIPSRMVVMHSCDVPLCVNPKHLSIGTQQDNMADRQAKGRTAKGQNAGPAKLTEEQAMYAKFSSEPTTVIGKELGVHPTCIGAIRSGKNWAHLPPITPENRQSAEEK